MTKRGRGKSQQSQDLIAWAVDWFAANHPASLRAACYKLFVTGFIKSMSKNETNRVSRLLRDAREDGTLPWDHVVDETREPEYVNAWRNPDQLIRATVDQYRRDYWQDQWRRVEVWSEKGTIRGTIAPVLREYGVTFRVMHGYGSATALNTIAEESIESNKPLTALYLGDWDPSGLHMSAVDIPGRIDRYGGTVKIRRIALTAHDVAEGTDLPHFAAATKAGDGRYKWFVDRYGHRCWELDALSPADLRERVADCIAALIDQNAWNRAIEVERAETESMSSFFETWEGISRQASKYPDGTA